MTLLSRIGAHANWFLAASVFIGLFVPDLATLARPALAPAVGLLLVVALLRVDETEIIATVTRRWPDLLMVWLTLMVLTPVCVLALLAVLQAQDWMPPALPTAVLMAACTASLIGTVSMSAIARLDSALALGTVLAATVTVPAITPWMTALLTGLSLAFDVWAFAERLAVLILGSIAVALVVRQVVAPSRLAAARTQMDGIFVLAMGTVALGMMDGLSDYVVERPGRAALFVAASFVLNLVLQAIAAGCYWALSMVATPIRRNAGSASGVPGRRELLTVGLLGGFRNLAFLIATLPAAADREIILFFALAQFPIYLMPLLTQAAYRRLLATADSLDG